MFRKITKDQANSMIDDIEYSGSRFRTEIISAWKANGYIKKDLKPCAHCGNDYLHFSSHIRRTKNNINTELFYIECENCRIRTCDFGCTHEAAEAWNKRV